MLNKAGINYMVTGAWSVIFHGRVRTSHDLDLVVEMEKKEVERMKRALAEAGEGFLFQDEAIEEAVKKRTMFQVFYQPSGDKIDFWLVRDEEFDRARFGRRVKVKVGGENIYVASAEDTILQKLK